MRLVAGLLASWPRFRSFPACNVVRKGRGDPMWGIEACAPIGDGIRCGFSGVGGLYPRVMTSVSLSEGGCISNLLEICVILSWQRDTSKATDERHCHRNSPIQNRRGDRPKKRRELFLRVSFFRSDLRTIQKRNTCASFIRIPRFLRCSSYECVMSFPARSRERIRKTNENSR